MKFKEVITFAEVSADFREAYAREVFNFQDVQEQITEAAAHGMARLRLSQKHPLNLSETKPARKLCDELKKRGFTHDWLQISQNIKYKNNTSELIAYQELIITWSVGYKEEYGGVAPE